MRNRADEPGGRRDEQGQIQGIRLAAGKLFEAAEQGAVKKQRDRPAHLQDQQPIVQVLPPPFRISQITADFNRILTEVQASEQETKNLARQIEEYQDYARRIHILGAEIDRLRAENKNFDEDVKKMRLKYADGINYEKKEEAYSLKTFLMAVEIESLRRRID